MPDIPHNPIPTLEQDTPTLGLRRRQLLDVMSAISEDRHDTGWYLGIERDLHREGGIWETIGRTIGWPTDCRNWSWVVFEDYWTWVTWDEARRLYAGGIPHAEGDHPVKSPVPADDAGGPAGPGIPRCTATWETERQGTATCWRAATHNATDETYEWHVGETEQGYRFQWTNKDKGATPHTVEATPKFSSITEHCACCGGGPMIPQTGNRTPGGRALCIPCSKGACGCKTGQEAQ